MTHEVVYLKIMQFSYGSKDPLVLRKLTGEKNLKKKQTRAKAGKEWKL